MKIEHLKHYAAILSGIGTGLWVSAFFINRFPTSLQLSKWLYISGFIILLASVFIRPGKKHYSV